MKTIFYIVVTLGICFPITIAQENIEAVQIVQPTEGHSFQYVKDNKLEKVLKSDEIKDRYVAVVSIVGPIQSGKSLMLNLFLNYLRTTYEVWSPFTNATYESDWTNMNVTNGFNAAQNTNGTTKGIWAWPEIFLHDNITYGEESGNKVAIILLDTEGLFHTHTDLRHNTMIFALSTMFSSMQGYNVFIAVNSDTMQFLDIFSTYTVYGSRLMANATTQEIPFQDFYFIVRESNNLDESEQNLLKRIFPDDDQNDQNREMKTRIKSVFKKIRAFQIPRPGEHVSQAAFNGSAALIDQRFKDRIATVVTDVLAPENIVIKEINGERVKAKELAHFLETFTDIVENNITIATTLVEVLANASNWMVYVNHVEYYDELMRASLDEVKNNTSMPYFEQEELNAVHSKNKNTTMNQFKNQVKLGGDKLASPFEKMLNETIDKHLDDFRTSNENMRYEFFKNREIRLSRMDGIKLWILVGLVVAVLLFAGVQTLRKKPEYFTCCRKAKPIPKKMKAVSKSLTKA